MKKIFKNNYVLFSLFTLIGLLLGWFLFHSSKSVVAHEPDLSQSVATRVWTCSMHPQIRMDKPGKCPLCAMDLIPLNQNTMSVDSDAIQLTPEAAQLANVLTSVVSSQKPDKEIRLYGKIQADERLLQNQVAHISGRVEKLLINFTGESVAKGQPLALINSPELLNAQQELLEAIKTKQSQSEIYEAAKDKLRQLKLTELQIETIEKTGEIQKNIEIVSDVTGIVIARRVNVGDYISQGSSLYDIADLSSVWALFDAYENDLPFLTEGNTLSFSVAALPNAKFSGNIVFIDPVIDPITRVAKVRVEIKNQSGKLKPEMFATGQVQANLAEYANKMIIPRSAVLWTGKRSVVYVKQADANMPTFKMREVELGPMLGSAYVILSGLNEGEEIVSQGTFNVDAAAQLEGKPSMMNKPNIKALPQTHKITKASFEVQGNCDLCKTRIENASRSVTGVVSAQWNSTTKQITVEYDSEIVSLKQIQQAIAKVGHDTKTAKANNETYNNLPACCQYR